MNSWHLGLNVILLLFDVVLLICYCWRVRSFPFFYFWILEFLFWCLCYLCFDVVCLICYGPCVRLCIRYAWICVCCLMLYGWFVICDVLFHCYLDSDFMVPFYVLCLLMYVWLCWCFIVFYLLCLNSCFLFNLTSFLICWSCVIDVLFVICYVWTPDCSLLIPFYLLMRYIWFVICDLFCLNFWCCV